jgi:hypothetical protein
LVLSVVGIPHSVKCGAYFLLGNTWVLCNIIVFLALPYHFVPSGSLARHHLGFGMRVIFEQQRITLFFVGKLVLPIFSILLRCE